MRTPLPDTTTRVSAGSTKTASSLRLPMSSPWTIVNVVGVVMRPVSRRYVPSAAAPAPVAGSSTTPPDGNGLREWYREALSGQKS